MLRLNGWQRLWIVLSVLYAVPVTLFTANSIAESEHLDSASSSYALKTFAESAENGKTEMLPLEKRRELAIDKARARLRLSGETPKDGGTDEEFVHTLSQKWGSLINFSEIEAAHQRNMEQLSLNRSKAIGYGFLAWVAPVALMYLLGLSLGWVVRGFRDRPLQRHQPGREKAPLRSAFARRLWRTLGVRRVAMAKDAIYEGTREVRTFVDLAHGADVLIMKTEQEPKGSYYTTMSALLLTAFTFEAYLNHLGEKTIKFLEEIEPIKVMDKYSVLCKNLNVCPDFSKRPYQTLKALFKFRNAIAHGKSQILQETKEVSSQDEPYQHSPKAHWEEFSVLENAKRAKEDVEQIITELHKTAGLGDYPFIHGAAIGSLSIKTPNPAVNPDAPKSGAPVT